MKKSFLTKVFGSYFLIIIVLSVLFSLLTFKAIKEFYISDLQVNLKNLSIGLATDVTFYIGANKIKELDDYIKHISKQINTRITVVDISGKVLGDSEKDPALMENHSDRIEIIQAIKEGYGSAIRLSPTVKEEMLYVAIPIKSENKTVAVLRTSLFLKDINNFLVSLKLKILIITLAVMILALMLALIFTIRLSRQIRELANISRRIAEGDFNAKILIKSNDELKGLADSFNYMSDKIRHAIEDLKHQKEELNAIISSIKEALVVIDKSGKIIFSNKSFEEIFKYNSTENKFYWEVIRNQEFRILVEEITKTKKDLYRELEINQKYYLCSLGRVVSRQELIVILHDITQLKLLDKIKKDIIANASHELRTPLTAIKGYIETMYENASDNQRHYFEIIRRNTERLINIISDLLALSELEKTDEKLFLEQINVAQLVGDVLKLFEQRVSEKKLKFVVSIAGDLPQLKADPFRIEQVLVNLIDNAVKYTERGEIKISVNLVDRYFNFVIEDTGIGIPKDHLDRIFERFYVVDKSRSRESGGTGLGLSIVKHIVLLHNGKIDVESTTGVGTKFIVSLPRHP